MVDKYLGGIKILFLVPIIVELLLRLFLICELMAIYIPVSGETLT